jgi:hypothetical protein
MGKEETVRQEIEKAVRLHQKYDQVILNDSDILFLIERYRDAIEDNLLSMREAGVAEACSSCAAVHTNGCCFKGVEDWYDCYLLLTNLLLDGDLPLEADYPDSCLFVGDKGCKLMARHSFCVNFLCPDLLKGIDPAQREILLRTTANELQAGWKLEKALRDLLSLKL